MKRFLSILLTALAALSCSREQVQPVDVLSIEAVIEAGRPPVVYVTSAIAPPAEPMELSAIGNYVVKWAKVTISDGTKEVILNGIASKRYYPQFAYTTAEMEGETGKTYTIKVEYKSHTATATATVPALPPVADGMDVIPYSDDTPDEYLIKARFRDNPSTHDYYGFFVKVKGMDSTYVASQMSFMDDSVASGDDVEVIILPGIHTMRKGRFLAYKPGQTVWVKMCTMPKYMYDIWKVMVEQGMSGLPVLSVDKNIPGNFTGANGFFAGYGIREYKVVMPDPQ